MARNAEIRWITELHKWYFLYIHKQIRLKVPILLYFDRPKRPSGNCYISCFLTDKTALLRPELRKKSAGWYWILDLPLLSIRQCTELKMHLHFTLLLHFSNFYAQSMLVCLGLKSFIVSVNDITVACIIVRRLLISVHKWQSSSMAATHEYWSQHDAHLVYLPIFHGLNLIIFS